MMIRIAPMIIIIVMMMHMRIFGTAGGFAKRGVGRNSSKAVQNSLQGSTSKCAKEYWSIVMCKGRNSKQEKCGIDE